MEDTTYRWPPQDDGQKPKEKKPLPDLKKLMSTVLIAALAIAIGMAAMTCFYTVDDKQQAAEFRAQFKAANRDNADFQKAWLLYNK